MKKTKRKLQIIQGERVNNYERQHIVINTENKTYHLRTMTAIKEDDFTRVVGALRLDKKTSKAFLDKFKLVKKAEFTYPKK